MLYGMTKIAELNFNSKSLREDTILQQVNKVEVSSDLYILITLKVQPLNFIHQNE